MNFLKFMCSTKCYNVNFVKSVKLCVWFHNYSYTFTNSSSNNNTPICRLSLKLMSSWKSVRETDVA